MKVYCVCYTRTDFLTTFQNLPFEYKYILKELQLEKMSEAEQDGFVWKTHSKNMYSYTWVHSFWDQNIDKRKIPLLASFVMDEEAAEQILQEPSRLVSLTEKLSRTTYEEAIQFSNKEVKGRWEEDVIVEEKKVNGNEKNVSRLVKGMVKVFCGTENKHSYCFIDASAADDFIDALRRIPLELRLELSFAFPYPGSGACLGNINLVRREVLELERQKSFDGWPVGKRLFLNDSLTLTANESRIYYEMEILYNEYKEYKEFPFHGSSSKEILDKLLVLSYIREFVNEGSAESRNFLFERKNDKELVLDLSSYLKKPILNKLLDLWKTTEEMTTEKSKKRVKKTYPKKKHCAIFKFSYRKLIIIALWNLLLLSTFFFFNVHMNENLHITFSFETKNLAAYLLAILQGVVTSQLLFMRKRGKGE